MNVWITGMGGFVAPVLAKHCLDSGDTVYGSFHRRPSPDVLKKIPAGVHTFVYDLISHNNLPEDFQTFNLDSVVHLGGITSLKESLENPRLLLRTNVFASVSLYKTIIKNHPGARMLFISSGAVYRSGNCPGGGFTEASSIHPHNLYAMSKWLMEIALQKQKIKEKVNFIIARSFNHIGPGQDERFVVSNFISQIAGMKKKSSADKRLLVGNIDISRDFLDVEDVVRAYRLLLLKGKTGEIYNVARGKSYSLRDILDKSRTISGVDFKIIEDPDRLRNNDPAVLKGNPQKLTSSTGWRPTVPIFDTLRKIFSARMREKRMEISNPGNPDSRGFPL